uniref:Sulfotransferase n=1 Tax=Fagus sylvatica TaxID=28930 RepID=A0A2N9J8J7_FAGSY
MSDPKALNEYKEKIATLPRREGWMADQVYHYQGFWHNSSFLEGVMLAQEHFQPQPNDIILSSFPKSGTTWLKALPFAIVTRSSFDASTNPLLTTTPHKCVLSLESDLAHNSFHRNLDTPLIGKYGCGNRTR